MFFFFNDTATTEIYTLSLHDALPISDLDHPHLAGVRLARVDPQARLGRVEGRGRHRTDRGPVHLAGRGVDAARHVRDWKSTRLNSSHANISYAVFCLKKKKSHIDRL